MTAIHQLMMIIEAIGEMVLDAPAAIRDLTSIIYKLLAAGVKAVLLIALVIVLDFWWLFAIFHFIVSR